MSVANRAGRRVYGGATLKFYAALSSLLYGAYQHRVYIRRSGLWAFVASSALSFTVGLAIFYHLG